MEPCRSHRAIWVGDPAGTRRRRLAIRRSFRSRPRRPHLLQASSTISSEGGERGQVRPDDLRIMIRCSRPHALLASWHNPLR
jgi:hypothetical protein